MIEFHLEGKAETLAANFGKIEKGLRTLKSYGKHSFASLSRDDGSYIQVAGGGQTCVVEMRLPGSDAQLRAYLDAARVPFEGEQTLLFGGGQLTMQPDEILSIDSVIELFRSFYESERFPSQVKWRDISQILNDG